MIEHRDDHPCPYLPARGATTHYRYLERCDAETYQGLLERGWRRFGRVFFRPECAGCGECRSLRLDVASFVPDRSMRRTARANQDVQVELSRPSATARHLELFERYHRAQEEHRGWPGRPTDPVDYAHSFVEGAGTFGHELRFQVDGALIAVALVDLLPRALSAVYCYYDPELRRRAPGVLSVLCQVQLARRLGVPHLYLGYWVEPNASMRYKARYRPHSLLRGRPADVADPAWLPAIPVENVRPA